MSVAISENASTHSVNIRRAHAEYLSMLAEALEVDVSIACRALVDNSFKHEGGEQDTLAKLDFSKQQKTLKKLYKQAQDKRQWTALDIELRDDQVLLLTERAMERRSSLSRELRRIVASHLEKTIGGPPKSVNMEALFDSFFDSVIDHGPTVAKLGGALLALGVLAGAGLWAYNNLYQADDSDVPQGEIVIDSLEALEELERRNREAARQNQENN